MYTFTVQFKNTKDLNSQLEKFIKDFNGHDTVVAEPTTVTEVAQQETVEVQTETKPAKKTTAKKTTAKKKATKKKAAAKKEVEPPSVTMEMVGKALKEVMDVLGKGVALSVLNEFGYKKISAIDEKDYAALVDYCQQTLDSAGEEVVEDEEDPFA